MADVYVIPSNTWTSLNGMESFNASDVSQGELTLLAGKEYIVEINAGVAGGTSGIFIYQGEKPSDDGNALGSSLTIYDGQATLSIGVSETWIKLYREDVPTKLNILGVD